MLRASKQPESRRGKSVCLFAPKECIIFIRRAAFIQHNKHVTIRAREFPAICLHPATRRVARYVRSTKPPPSQHNSDTHSNPSNAQPTTQKHARTHAIQQKRRLIPFTETVLRSRHSWLLCVDGWVDRYVWCSNRGIVLYDGRCSPPRMGNKKRNIKKAGSWGAEMNEYAWNE